MIILRNFPFPQLFDDICHFTYYFCGNRKFLILIIIPSIFVRFSNGWYQIVRKVEYNQKKKIYIFFYLPPHQEGEPLISQFNDFGGNFGVQRLPPPNVVEGKKKIFFFWLYSTFRTICYQPFENLTKIDQIIINIRNFLFPRKQ